MRLLITGSTGFVGRNLTSHITNDPRYELVTLDREGPGRVSTSLRRTIDWTCEEIKDAVASIAPDSIVHLCESRDRKNGLDGVCRLINDNLFPFCALLEGAEALQKPVRVVYIDSASVYGRNAAPFRETMQPAPLTAYALVKQYAVAMLSQVAHTSEVEHTVLRAGVVYGPGQTSGMFLPDLIRSLLSNQGFDMGDPSKTRDFLYIDDLSSAIELALAEPRARNTIINVGSGIATRLDSAARQVQAAIGSDSSLLHFGVLGNSDLDQQDYRLDVSRATKVLGWTAETRFSDGISWTVEWMRRGSV